MPSKPTPTTPEPSDQTAGWLANALAWIRRATEARHTLLDSRPDVRRGSIINIWSDGNETETHLDPPGQLLTFTDPAQFAAAIHEATAASQPQPVTVTSRNATWLANHGHLAYRLTWNTHPALDLLDQLENKRNSPAAWKSHQEAYDLARLQLAPLLPANMAETIGRAAWKITATTARQLGATADKGIREFATEAQTDGPAEPLKPTAYNLTVPVFYLIGAGELATIAAPLALEITGRLQGEETCYRIAPLAGQCDLARAEATRLIAVKIAQDLAELDAPATTTAWWPPRVWLAAAKRLPPNADPYTA